MGGHQRRIRQRRHIVKALFIQMAEVDHDLQPVAFGHQPLARLGQARPGVGAGRKGKGHAMAKDRRARPDRAKRAQAERVERIERIEIGVDRLGAFHMHDAGDDAFGHRGADLARRAADAESAVRRALHPEHQPRRTQSRIGSLGGIHQRGQRQPVGRIGHLRHQIGIVMGHGGRQIDREKAARKPARAHPRQVQLPPALAGQPDVAPLFRRFQKPQQQIVVAVKDRDHRVSFPAGSSIRSAEAANRLCA